MPVDDELTPGDSSRVTTFQLYQRLERLDRENEARYAELRSDVRALNQTLGAIMQAQVDHEQRIRSVERWKLSVPVSVLLALATVIGAALSGRGI